jgi:hypothetical protein
MTTTTKFHKFHYFFFLNTVITAIFHFLNVTGEFPNFY